MASKPNDRLPFANIDLCALELIRRLSRVCIGARCCKLHYVRQQMHLIPGVQLRLQWPIQRRSRILRWPKLGNFECESWSLLWWSPELLLLNYFFFTPVFRAIFCLNCGRVIANFHFAFSPPHNRTLLLRSVIPSNRMPFQSALVLLRIVRRDQKQTIH